MRKDALPSRQCFEGDRGKEKNWKLKGKEGSNGKIEGKRRKQRENKKEKRKQREIKKEKRGGRMQSFRLLR